MGDDDDRLAPDHLGNGGVHFLLILRVQKSGGLVQHHDGSVLQNRPGQGDPLPLAAGKPFAAIAGHGIDSFFQPFQKFSALSPFRRRQHLLVRGVRLSQADVLLERAVKEEVVLGDEADGLGELFQRHFPDVPPTQGDGAGRHIPEAGSQPGDGGLAAS